MLFIILISIALFVALSFAVTGSQSGGGKNAGDEKASATASQILNQMNQIKGGVDRLRLTNGCDDAVIDFYVAGSTYYSTTYFYPDASAPTDRRCSLYHPDGAGVGMAEIPDDAGWVDDLILSNRWWIAHAYVPTRLFLEGIGRPYTDNANNQANELLISVKFASEAVCKAFNRQVGFMEGQTPPQLTTGGQFFSISCGISIAKSCSTANRIWGTPMANAHAACFQSTVSGSYVTAPHYTAYMVLVPG